MRRWWLCGVTAALLLAGWIAPRPVWAELPPTAQRVSVLPDSEGTISEVLIHYDADIGESLDSVYRDLFRVLPPDVAATVISPSRDSTLHFLNTWGPIALKNNRSVNVLDLDMPISIWARDRVIARQDSALQSEMSPLTPEGWNSYEECKTNELVLGDILSLVRLTGPGARGRLRVEGGNIVANRRHVFLGSNVVDENSDLADADEVHRDLLQYLGRDFVLIGDAVGAVPWVHIDMYLTPISDDLVLVGSVHLGEELAGLDCEQDGDQGLPGIPLPQTCPADMFQQQLDEVADAVRRLGYKVVRIPALADPQDGWMITYNNVLMEERLGKRIVYMPTYAAPTLDTAAAAVYERLGFEVRTIDVSGIYESGGALRCMVNVVRRRQPNHPLPQPGSVTASSTPQLRVRSVGRVGEVLRKNRARS